MTLYSLFLPADEMQMASIINVFIMQIDIFKNNQTELTTSIPTRFRLHSILSEKHVCAMPFFFT